MNSRQDVRSPLFSDPSEAFERSEASQSLTRSEEGDLTEEELRGLYDNEEIDRFLTLFSAYVTEVQAPETPKVHSRLNELGSGRIGESSPDSLSSNPPVEDGEWTPIRTESGEISSRPLIDEHKASEKSHYGSLSEAIASKYLLPILPLPPPAAPSFTIGRLRIAVQRLYLAAFPAYSAFFASIVELSTWENYWSSFSYCLLYWVLWWYDLLPSAFVLRLFFGVLRRRMFSYPTLDELRKHREEIVQANELGERISARLSASSFGVTEVWRLFKLLDNKRKSKKKKKVEDDAKLKSSGNIPDADYQETTILDTVEETDESRDLKRIGLQVLEELADLHERIRNVLIWRKPASSRKYGFILFVIFLTTLLPTRYILKSTLFILGFLFWHAVPLFASLSPSDRRRLPPVLHDVPTDADYAMEIISQRVAAGLQVQPSKLPKQSKRHKPSSSDSMSLDTSSTQDERSGSRSRENPIDWKKWGNRVAAGKSVANDLRRLKPGSTWPIHEVWPPRSPLSSRGAIAQPEANTEIYTYPCQHSSGPGLITLTPRTLLFTPLMSQTAKLTIQVSTVKGVKKAGILKGLNIRWNISSDGAKEQQEQEDKFAWVGGRDELFARLVGSDGMRWVKV